MLCIPIIGPTYPLAKEQLRKSTPFADFIEFRLDLFELVDFDEIKDLLNQCVGPAIFTYRKVSQGGKCTLSEKERLTIIEELLVLGPNYVDLEYDVPSFIIEGFQLRYPKIKWILSYHNFEETPSDLNEVWKKLNKHSAHFYKIACMARSSVDALAMLQLTKDSLGKLIGISMGEKGMITRILAPVVSAPFTFASLNEEGKTAPGQIHVEHLLTTYRFKSLNEHTQLFGLIGDPVSKSISDLTHNHLMEQMNIDAVYVKMEVKAEELSTIFQKCQMLGFKGLSVTMPLKELLFPFLDEVDPKAKAIGAVNTVHFERGKIKGYNTDGVGAMDALEEKFPLKNKKIIILGAGGAAKAIIYEALQRKAQVIVLNRTVNKAVELSHRWGVKAGGLEEIEHEAKKGYDAIINTTPDPLPIDPKWLLSNSVAMDIKTRPQHTEFLIEAKKKGCTLVYGAEMFINQATQQYDIWFAGKLNKEEVKKILYQKAFEVLA